MGHNRNDGHNPKLQVLIQPNIGLDSDVRQAVDKHANHEKLNTQSQELIPMSNKTNKTSKTNKTKTKRLPKGQRTHVRRLKQEANEAGSVYKPGNQ